jgi:hypothetical protein
MKIVFAPFAQRRYSFLAQVDDSNIRLIDKVMALQAYSGVVALTKVRSFFL